MLNVRLEGCGWSKELGRLPGLRIEGNVLTSSQHGEIARYGQGYWFAEGNAFISVVIEQGCFVRFEGGEEGEHSEPFGPYRLVRSSGGSIWVADSRERLLAKWEESDARWHCLLATVRPWPVAAFSASTFDP
ncbi:MAG TPA: hypothetical protein VIK18_06660 [Pirellulales bacterium]